MKIFTYTINNIYENFNKDALYFDIETTGLSPQNSHLYIIGLMYYDNDKIKIHQLFLDTLSDEKEAIITFFSYLYKFNTIISFNGDNFDIKYLSHLCNKYNIDNILLSFKSIDIYKEVAKYKKFFNFTNLKQKTIEEYLQYNRLDIFNGGELIELYNKYLLIDNSKEKENLLHILLRHNYDDMLGMAHISSILQYVKLFEYIKISNLKPISVNYASDNFNITNDIYSATYLTVSYKVPIVIPKDISFNNTHIVHIVKDDSNTYINIFYLILDTTLKYFLPDYKNYYYLTKENIIIHKDVAQFVDSKYKKKAKSSEAFLTKKSHFILLPKSYKNIFLNIKYFLCEYKSKDIYIETFDFINIIQNNEQNFDLLNIF